MAVAGSTCGLKTVQASCQTGSARRFGSLSLDGGVDHLNPQLTEKYAVRQDARRKRESFGMRRIFFQGVCMFACLLDSPTLKSAVRQVAKCLENKRRASRIPFTTTLNIYRKSGQPIGMPTIVNHDNIIS